jgi:hypothetical protein
MSNNVLNSWLLKADQTPGGFKERMSRWIVVSYSSLITFHWSIEATAHHFEALRALFASSGIWEAIHRVLHCIRVVRSHQKQLKGINSILERFYMGRHPERTCAEFWWINPLDYRPVFAIQIPNIRFISSWPFGIWIESHVILIGTTTFAEMEGPFIMEDHSRLMRVRSCRRCSKKPT